jgi:hypothetical protein
MLRYATAGLCVLNVLDLLSKPVRGLSRSRSLQTVAGNKRNILGQYLHAPFSLRKGQLPHLLKF